MASATTTKYYKLKSDLPTFKAGDVFKINWSGHLEYVKGAQEVKKGQELIAYTKMTLDKFPDILKDWFEEMPDYNIYTKWRAEIGEGYWFVDSDGRISFTNEYNSSADLYRWSTGNYFESKTETEEYREYLYAFNTLLTDAKGGGYVIGGDYNWTVYYDNRAKNYDSVDGIDGPQIGGVWFQDLNTLERSLKKHRRQWDTVRDYYRINRK